MIYDIQILELCFYCRFRFIHEKAFQKICIMFNNPITDIHLCVLLHTHLGITDWINWLVKFEFYGKLLRLVQNVSAAPSAFAHHPTFYKHIYAFRFFCLKFSSLCCRQKKI